MQPLDFQKPTVAEITARARAFFAFHEEQYRDIRDSGLQPRWATIIAAPTGVGKSMSAAMVADAIGASLCRISAPSYMPSGAHNRTTKESIGVIAQHVAQHDRTILFLDELDKINDQENVWQGYCRNELYDLIGGDWPTGMNLPELDKGPDPTIEELTKKLRTTVFFLAAGTFQQFFDGACERRTMGFGAQDQENEVITADIIAQNIPREMANRFGKIVRLPELGEKDYRQIAREAERKLPERLREKFRAETSQRIEMALRDKKGVRFIEEALTDVLIDMS